MICMGQGTLQGEARICTFKKHTITYTIYITQIIVNHSRRVLAISHCIFNLLCYFQHVLQGPNNAAEVLILCCVIKPLISWSTEKTGIVYFRVRDCMYYMIILMVLLCDVVRVRHGMSRKMWRPRLFISQQTRIGNSICTCRDHG